MADVIPLTNQLDPLRELQKAFCLLKLSGDVFICDREQIEAVRSGRDMNGLEMYRMAAGNLLMRRHLEALPISTDPKKVIAEFLSSPSTIIYDRIAFSPLPTAETTLNLWGASKLNSAPGDWNMLKGFLLEDIANGDIRLFRYLMLYLAHMVQRPGEKPGVMISLIGGQGTGKGTFLRIIERIWPHSSLLVSDVDHVIGRFNAAIEGKFAVCMDEALFAGDKRAMDRLKSLVTEPTVTIEQKNQPRRTIESYHRFFSASNHAHFAQVDADDRRFMFYKVSERRQGDAEYWEKLHAAINDPTVIAAMVHDLTRYDLTRFNVRQRPRTEAHMDQKLRSLTGFDRYWHNVLRTGDTSPGSDEIYPNGVGWQDGLFVASKALLSGWKGLEKSIRQFEPHQERDVHIGLARLCPSAKSGRHLDRGSQKRGFYLPPLSVARAEFEQAMGGKVEWDDQCEVEE